MLLTRIGATEITQVYPARDLYPAVAQLSRELEQITSTLEVLFREGMTQRMRRHPHIINAALPLEGVGLLSLALAMTLNPHIRKMRFPQSRR